MRTRIRLFFRSTYRISGRRLRRRWHGRPALETLRAFRVGGRTGVNYNRGTWHHGMTTIGESGTFAMLVHEDGTAGDCQFVEVDPIIVEA